MKNFNSILFECLARLLSFDVYFPLLILKLAREGQVGGTLKNSKTMLLFIYQNGRNQVSIQRCKLA